MDTSARAAVSAQVFGTMAQLVHRTGQEAGAILRAEGLNSAQFQLLLAVADTPGCTQRDLHTRRGVTAANVSMLVSKLAGAGLLRREADGASNRLHLTAAGASVVDRLRPAQDDFLVGRFTGLDDADLHRLGDLLQRAWEALPPSAG